MKKFLFLALAAILFVAGATITPPAYAQTVTALASSAGNDTVSGAGVTRYLTSRIYGTGTVALQLDLTKVSGTVAGTVLIEGSVDANYTPVKWTTISNDTLTLANGDNVKIWILPADYLHYRMKIVTTGGSQVFTAKGYYYLKGNPPPVRNAD